MQKSKWHGVETIYIFNAMQIVACEYTISEMTESERIIQNLKLVAGFRKSPHKTRFVRLCKLNRSVGWKTRRGVQKRISLISIWITFLSLSVLHYNLMVLWYLGFTHLKVHFRAHRWINLIFCSWKSNWKSFDNIILFDNILGT